jgi:hypothetical protein
MSAADQLTQEVTREIAALPTGRYGEVIFDEGLFRDLPTLEEVLAPESDVRDGLDEESLLSEMWDHPSLLGCYVPMHSPGRIFLSRRNLHQFYWSLVGSLPHGLPYLFPLDLEGALHLVVKQTDQHDRFHFHSDVLRQLFGGPCDPLLEEALAVAWSRMKILEEPWSSKIGRMNRVLYNRLLVAAFAYRSPGYCDWSNYSDAPRFKDACLDYLSPPNYRRLQGNGVSNLQDLMFGLLGQVRGGCLARLL